jgi:hypothetical protein
MFASKLQNTVVPALLPTASVVLLIQPPLLARLVRKAPDGRRLRIKELKIFAKYF